MICPPRFARHGLSFRVRLHLQDTLRLPCSRFGARLRRVSRIDRWFWALCLIGSFATLLTAFLLRPDPSGMGTHEQLGLPPCGMVTLWGLPCPGCGLTTSFSALMHGQWRAAWHANPAGLLVFSCVVALPWIAGWALVRGVSVGRALSFRPLFYVFASLAGALLISWGLRLWRLLV